MASVLNRVLWWSLVVSLLIYVAVAHVVSMPADPDTPIPLLAGALGMLSVGLGIGTLLYRRHALVNPIQRGDLDLTNLQHQAKAFQAFTLCLVLSEAVGIFGLVLALLAGRGAYCVPFVLAALALLYAHRPTAPDLQAPPGGGHSEGRPRPIA